MAATSVGATGARSGRTDRSINRSPRRAGARRGLIAWAFCLPFVVVFGVFMVVPIIGSFAMSFTDFRAGDISTPFAVSFVGLGQYATLLDDPRFLTSLGVTGVFVLVGIPATMALALLLAFALNSSRGWLITVFRVGYYIPVVTAIVAMAVVWRFILQDDGLLNQALALVGIQGPDWLNDTTWALPSLIMMAVWRNVGTLMVIFLAGLQAIPEDVKEAAIMDGASRGRRLFSVTLPLLRPTLLLGAVLISVGYLQFFDEAFIMTGGGPLDSTLSVSYYTYQQFGFGEYGTASAASYILFLAIAIVSLIQFRLLRSQDT